MEAPSTTSVVTAFRDVMAGVCTPVSVVTAFEGKRPHGTTVSAFASLSMNPPMVLVALDRNSDLLQLVHDSGSFGVNVLSSEQAELATRFARKGSTKFDHVPWFEASGVPRLHGVSGWLACSVNGLVDGGDHVIALGSIGAAERLPAAPLTYHDRVFGTHQALEVPPR